jgi:4-amino-4-deoxy-L-arabinose transferase-like glycosyltransferase
LLKLIILSISDIIFTFLLLILSLGLGKKIWSRWFDPPVTPINIIEEGIFCVTIGIGILSLIILVIGLSGFLQFWSVLSIFILLLFFVFKEIKRYFLSFDHIKKILFYSLFHTHLFLILLPFFIAAFIWLFLASRVPPVFYDALVYHLGIPNQYLIHHSIRFLPYTIHSHHPFLIQNLFSICLLLGGQGTTKLLVLMLAIFNAFSLSLFAMRLCKRSVAWLAGGIFLLTPSILITGALVNVDLGFSLYTLLAFYALCMWAIKKDNKWLIVSALMTGFSLGTKYTGIIFCFGLCVLCLIFILIKERQDLRYTLKTIIIYVFISLSIGSGWYIKNLVWTQNPFYPKWADVWGNPKIPKKNLDAFNSSANAYNAKDNTRNSILTLPLDLVLHPEWFGVGGTLGPLFLILLPLAFVPDKKNKLYYILALYCIIYYFAWAYTFRMTRFALPLFAILILLATGTLARLFQRKRKLYRYIIITILMLGFLYNLYYSIAQFSHVYDPWKYLTGKEPEESYLSRAIPSYPIFRYINNNLPSNSRILFLGETINFYCHRDVISSTAFDINPIIPVLKNAKTKEEVYAYLKLIGVTHLLINFPGMERLERSYRTFGFEDKDLRLLGDILRSSPILSRRVLSRGGEIILIKV